MLHLVNYLSRSGYLNLKVIFSDAESFRVSSKVPLLTPRSHRATTLVRSCRLSHDLKKYWIGTNRDRSASKLSNLAIMVFITTVLRCSHVQRAANTLLPRCYEDNLPTSGRVYCVYTTLSLQCLRSYYDATQIYKTILRHRYGYADHITFVVRFSYDLCNDLRLFWVSNIVFCFSCMDKMM
jgi:hypothetical protein